MKTTDKRHAKAKSSLFMGFLRQASFLRRKKIRKTRENFKGDYILHRTRATPTAAWGSGGVIGCWYPGQRPTKGNGQMDIRK
jgi:hypothetical protein